MTSRCNRRTFLAQVVSAAAVVGSTTAARAVPDPVAPPRKVWSPRIRGLRGYDAQLRHHTRLGSDLRDMKYAGMEAID